MKKAYKLQNLGCANCAAKMEAGIAKLPGVAHASVAFMTQRLVIEAEAERFPALLDEAQAIISKIEPDCVIKR